MACGYLRVPHREPPQVVGLSCHPPRLRFFKLTFGALALTVFRRFLRCDKNALRGLRSRSVCLPRPGFPLPDSLGIRPTDHRWSAACIASSSTSRCASTPTTTLRPLLRQAGYHPSRSFRPRGFAPPRRFPPRHRLRTYCIPLPILRFIAFLGCSPVPATLLVPLEEYCFRRAASCHHDRCHRAVSTTSWPCSLREPVVTPHV